MAALLNGSINATSLGTSLQTADLSTITGTLKPLLVTIAAIVIYSILIFKFYRFLAERDILKLKLAKRGETHEGFLRKLITTLFYLLEHVVIVPVLVFFWFAVLASLLILLSRNTPGQVMLIAMAIIGAVRVTAYYNEDLSKDLAKMIPFALLGVVLVDSSYVSLETVKNSFKEIPLFLDKAVFYLLFVAALELVMRIVHLIRAAVKPEKAPASQQ